MNSFKTVIRKIWDILLVARYFLPICSTIGYLLSKADILLGLAGFLFVVGLISTLCTAPIKIFKFSFVFIVSAAGFAFKISAIFGFVAFLVAFIAGAFAAVGCLGAILYAPIIFTMYKFFTDSKYFQKKTKERKSKIVA